MSTCEFLVRKDGLRCTRLAAWLVGIGGRAHDRQLACKLHLSQTFHAMLEAEKPRNAMLTVIALTQEDDHER